MYGATRTRSPTRCTTRARATAATPSAFLDAVADSLELSAADLQQAIAEACSRYGTRKANGLEDPQAPGAFDVVPPSITAILGDASTPEALVDAYCSAG